MKRIVIFSIMFFLIPFALASTNLTSKEIASDCLNESSSIVDTMASYNISVSRFNDTLLKARDLYDAQIIIESRNNRPNYDMIISYCTEIRELKESAIFALDTYGVFLNFYHETIDENMDSSPIDSIVSQINSEISGERYENVPKLIDRGYEEISKVKSEQTAITLAYRATTRGVGFFIISNWTTIVSSLVLLLCFYLLYRTKISLWILQKKLKKLMLRRDTLRGLMGKAQKDYFQQGSISEVTYRMRIKNFGEIVRDIDRQVPLIQKEIAKYSFNKKEYEKLKETDRERARRGIAT